MNKEYKIKLDLNKKLYNKKMAFNQFDENVNDFYIEITKNNEIVKDLDKAIVVLAVIKPNKEVDSQFVEVENGLVYADLKPSMKDEIGIYTARAMLILEDERVVTDVISYEVKEDKIFSLLNDTVVATEKFTLLTDMLSRLSTIELNENNREETFNNIKDEFEIIKNNHNELVTTETDNKVTELLGPVVSKANEKINEVDNKISETDRFVEAKELEINENLKENTKKVDNKIVDIENAISEANSKIDNAIAKIPPKSELIGEKGDKGEKGEKGDKGDRGEQGLQGIQGIQGIQGERGLQGVKGDKGDKGEQGIQGLKGDKGDKGDRGEQGVKGDTPSIAHLEASINNKIQEVETRFNTLTSTQQQETEVIDARDGEVSLKTRLDRDIEKVKQVYVKLDGLQEQVSNVDSQLEHIAINIFNYLDYVVVVNGKEDWKPAFDKAFEDLQDGGTLLIPKHDYYISTRSTLENKKNIIINCAGKIMPIDGNIPLIGTITLNNLKDCVVNGLNMDGNIDNITYTNTYGTQSLLRMDNCSNIIFNNIKLENTCENGFSSNGNLNNILFNNVEINSMGEHGFYFGGTNCNNIKFNNITCTDIGLNDSCSSRHCGVIKFRNKQLGDIMHDNIAIDGFNFISNQTDITGHRQLVCGYDVKNLTIKNGTIRGERTSIFSSNISLDNFIIDNVILDGLQIFYGLNKGNDYSVELEQGRMYIAILNSDLYCSSNYNGSISLISNSKYKIKEVMDDKMSIDGYIRDVVYDNVEFDINEKYFNISKIDRNYEFRNCIFKNKTNTSPLFNLASTSSDENCKFSLINCLETETHSISVQSNNKFDLSIINSTLKGEIKTLSSQLRNLIINNSNVLRGKIDTYAIADNFILNGIYDLNGKRYDMCVNNATCKSYNTFVNLSLKHEIARDIDLSKLIITNNKNIPYEVTNSENVLQLSTIERQESDTVFSVFYTI